MRHDSPLAPRNVAQEEAHRMNAETSPPSPLVRGSIWKGRIGGCIAAVIVLLVPLVLVMVSLLFANVSAEEAEPLPLWATQAFSDELLLAFFAAVRLPWPILMGNGLVLVGLPPILALIGLGTLGRWAALAGFCGIGSLLGIVLGFGLLLELVAPGSPGTAVRLEVVTGLSWPMLALECGGCLLAASMASSGVDVRAEHRQSS